MVRKRGEALLDAVEVATLAEVAERGIRGASMDRIAHRAGTGKAALYRRWPNVRALVIDVFATTLEEQSVMDLPDLGCLRDDLLAHFRAFTDQMNGPLGLILRELISEAVHDNSIALDVQGRFGLKLQAQAVAMLQRGMARGEIPVRPVDPYVLQIPAAFVIHQFVMAGTGPSPEDVEHIVDSIVLPLLTRPV
jgi:AcrR family transcriptional regulator